MRKDNFYATRLQWNNEDGYMLLQIHSNGYFVAEQWTPSLDFIKACGASVAVIDRQGYEEIKKSAFRKERSSVSFEQVKSTEDKVQELVDKLELGIKDLFESDKYKNYLKVMSKFHNYSVNNSILIALQKPDATYVAGYTAWERKFHRNVRKGEKGIHILSPSPYKIERHVQKLDSNTHQPLFDAEGQPIMEHKEITIPSYKVTTVFDVSQTEGQELPEIVTELKLDVNSYEELMSVIKEVSPVPIEIGEICGTARGYYDSNEKKIVVQDEMSEQQTLKTCIHEIAHALLHDKECGEEESRFLDRHTKEVEAESIACVVCQHFGIDTSEYSFGYIAGWSTGRELEELKRSMNIIRNTASEIIKFVERKIVETREHSISCDFLQAMSEDSRKINEQNRTHEETKNNMQIKRRYR